MALIQATLASGLATMTPTTSESAAIATFTDAWITFFSTASAGVVPIIPAALQTTPKTAMISALTGISAGGGSVKITNAITAFWAACVPLAATLFPAATLIIPPPTLATLSTALDAVLASNLAAKADLTTAANAIAAVLYTNGAIGGTATISVPPPTVFPIA